ncbi:hypothetical protein V5799_008979 [Amblyomma americanum]|uniref:Uncharacterized protein n=1 Tax=Amblyomma americanum TaxID=6943 RepID=A0AAQ4FBV7_AMBAM
MCARSTSTASITYGISWQTGDPRRVPGRRRPSGCRETRRPATSSRQRPDADATTGPGQCVPGVELRTCTTQKLTGGSAVLTSICRAPFTTDLHHTGSGVQRWQNHKGQLLGNASC